MSSQRSVLLVMMTVLVAVVSAEIVNSDLALPKEISSGPRNVSVSEQISQLLDLFNTNRLAENWFSISDMLSPNCSRDMEQYLQGLAEHAVWAMKSTCGPLNKFMLVNVCNHWPLSTRMCFECYYYSMIVDHAYHPPTTTHMCVSDFIR